MEFRGPPNSTKGEAVTESNLYLHFFFLHTYYQMLLCLKYKVITSWTSNLVNIFLSSHITFQHEYYSFLRLRWDILGCLTPYITSSSCHITGWAKKRSWKVIIGIFIGYISSASYIYHSKKVLLIADSRNIWIHGFQQTSSISVSSRNLSTTNPDFEKRNELG